MNMIYHRVGSSRNSNVDFISTNILLSNSRSLDSRVQNWELGLTGSQLLHLNASVFALLNDGT